MMARWLPQQIPPLNFLDYDTELGENSKYMQISNKFVGYMLRHVRMF